MKKYLFLLLAGGALWTACGDNASSSNETSDSSTVSSSADTATASTDMSNKDTSSTSTGSTQPLDSKSQEFASEAATAGMMEVDLGKLAGTSAENARVKEYGAMMVKDHEAAGSELTAIVNRKNFTPKLDHEKHMKMKEDLSKKKGADFDKAYMKMMTEDHKKVISKFEDAAKNSTDADIKAFAEKTLPVLKAHHDSAQAIAKSLK